MNFEYMIKNITLAKLDESHDVSKFKSKYEKADNFLKNEALGLQDTREPMTMLLMYKDEIIGFYTTGIPDYTFNEETIKNLIASGANPNEIENVIYGEIQKFTIHEKYDEKDFVLQLFGKIFASTKLMMRAITTDEPIAVLVNPDCNIPATHDEILKEIEKVNERLKHPMYMAIKGTLAEE